MFDLAEGIPDSKRKSALTLLVRKWSPYPSTGFAAHWVGRRATVYAWDAAKIGAAIAEAGLPAGRCSILPETFIREPLQDGTRLAAMSDGVEGQVWHNGLVAATRWWPAPPPLREWIGFLRGAGTDVIQSAPSQPTPVETPLLEMPWTAAVTPITDFWSLLQNDRAAAIAATAVAVPFLYLIAQITVLGIANGRMDVTMAIMSEANKAIRADRGAAINDLDAAQQYLALETYPSQFELLAATSRLLRHKQLSIMEWTYGSGNLELTIKGNSDLDATFYIKEFERDPLFMNVTGSSDGQAQGLKLRMQVVPKAQAQS